MIRTLLIFSLAAPQAFAIPGARPEVANVVSDDQALPVEKAVVSEGELEKLQLQKINTELEETSTNPHPDIGGINVSFAGTEARGTGLPDFEMSEAYDTVVVINKATDVDTQVQTLTLYRFKTVNGRRIALTPEKYRVSTGKERWACEAVRENGVVVRREARWLGTPTGFYAPQFQRGDYKSNTYDSAPMPYATFFNKLGIATHVGKTDDPRLSHGCVRMSEVGARDVFKAVMQSGGPVGVGPGRGSCPLLGKYVPCQQVVDEAIAEGHQNGFGPYSARPLVPVIDKNGRVKRDDAGQPDFKEGYKALFVVQCIDRNGRDCSTSKIPPKPNCQRAAAPAVAQGGQAQPGSPRPAPAPSQTPVNPFKALFNAFDI